MKSGWTVLSLSVQTVDFICSAELGQKGKENRRSHAELWDPTASCVLTNCRQLFVDGLSSDRREEESARFGLFGENDIQGTFYKV